MKKWSKSKKVLVALLAFFIIAQAIRPAKNAGNATGPRDITSVVTVPDSIMGVLQKSCYDCHSDHTDYPWYDQITPVNWWVDQHIKDGKRELNFTTFGEYPVKKMVRKIEEIGETIEKKEMPLPSYLWMHGDAKLSSSERTAIINWVRVSQKALQP